MNLKILFRILKILKNLTNLKNIQSNNRNNFSLYCYHINWCCSLFFKNEKKEVLGNNSNESVNTIKNNLPKFNKKNVIDNLNLN